MNHKVLDRPEDLLQEESERDVSAFVGDDDDAPKLKDLLFDIGVAVVAYLTLGLVLDLVVRVLRL
jgi:hypothetical protein